ncbi:MAG: cyclic nucleotide-binding domain-containing protein [Azospirillum sp.]|nr:cyclic nucleotide-binding domain-containing protein [Azospirillum sp.]
MVEVTAISRPRRWDSPFDPALGDDDIDRILAAPMFNGLDQSRFPPTLSLREIIRNDSRIDRYRRGDIIVRNGDYGNSVFVILSGRVRVLIDEIPEIGRRPARRRRSPWRLFSQLWTNPPLPEGRAVDAWSPSAALHLRRESGPVRAYLPEVERVIAGHHTIPLAEGELFGEIAALSRTPRTATVFADSDCELVELRWQGLRDIRSRDDHLRAEIDRRHQDRALRAHLAETPLFAHLDDDTLAAIAAETRFESYGTTDLFSAFDRTDSQAEAGAALANEPLIAEEGTYLNDLIMIRAGFARITARLDHGHRTVGYVRQDDLFGLGELVEQWRSNEPAALRCSLRAIGYVDILRVPSPLIERHVLARLPADRLPPPPPHPASRPASLPAWQARDAEAGLEQSLADFLIDHRVINGTATMLINLNRCVGCDDCVRACAAAHGNNPRFVRDGPALGDVMVANACMHCIDSVCLIGCPTGAIHRDVATGRVLINEATCIGCGTCANSCPYDNIRMVEIRDRAGKFIVDRETNAPIRKATKCDLCSDQLGGPACQRACPHDALVRIDLREQDRLAQWVRR